jgi:hypothetical protein
MGNTFFSGLLGLNRMWDNPIDLIIAALNSALETAVTGLGEALRGLRIFYKKLKLLFRVLLITLLFIFPFLFFLCIGIKEEIVWMFGALLSIYAALIIRGFFKAVNRKAEVSEVPITNRLPISLVAIFALLDIALMSYWIASYNFGYNIVQEASFYLQRLREQYSLSALQLR